MHEKAIVAVQAIVNYLEEIEQPNAHEQEADTRARTLLRCLSQADQARAVEATAQAAADAPPEQVRLPGQTSSAQSSSAAGKASPDQSSPTAAPTTAKS